MLTGYYPHHLHSQGQVFINPHPDICSQRKSAGPTNVYKLFWSAYHQRLGELAMDVLGLDGQLVDEHGPVNDLQAMYLYGRAETIYGGSHQIQQNIIGERSLGLPAEPR